MSGQPTLSQHPFYTPAECAAVRDQVLSLEDKWTNRGAGFLPFFTLGTASYLDAGPESDTVYRQKAQHTNPILEAHFGELYARLTSLLAHCLHMPVSLESHLAYPGFHIFLANKQFERPIASSHFDLQFQSLKWDAYDSIDFKHPISFTCPFAMPKSGSGLNYWDIEGEKYMRASEDEIEALKAAQGTLFMPYSLGHLVLHQGLVLHQIAPSKDLSAEDERITLQGHGLVCDGIMRLYW